MTRKRPVDGLFDNRIISSQLLNLMPASVKCFLPTSLMYSPRDFLVLTILQTIN